jgi:hypothetical protein
MSVKYKIADWLEPVIDSIWKDKSQVIKNNEVFYMLEGVPEELQEELTEDVKIILTENSYKLLVESRTKTQFANKLCYVLTNGVVGTK